MITFQRDSAKFTYRVAGVVVHQERVLLMSGKEIDFWFLPGGRAELGETAADTLKREMYEELGVTIQVGRLLWVAENFFSHNGLEQHEVGFYFLMTLPPDSKLLAKSAPMPVVEPGANLFCQWHTLSSVIDLPLYPVFLRSALQALPPYPVHIVESQRV